MKRAFFFFGIVSLFIFTVNLFAVDLKVMDLEITPPRFVCQGVSPTEAQNNAKLRVVIKSEGGPSQMFVIAYGILQGSTQVEKGRQNVFPMTTPEETIYFSLDNIESGSHMFWVKIDPDGNLNDINPGNNYLQKQQILQKCPRDLAALKLTIESRITPESIDNLVLVKYVTKNNGLIKSLPSKADLKVNGTVIDTCKVPPLEKYVTFECKSWWKYKCPVTFTFTADSTNTNDEINENNNESDKYVYPCTTKKFSRDLLKSIPAKKK